MTDFDDLDGSDGPRPLPPAARDRIESTLLGRAELLASDDSLLAGVDAPRPLPPTLHDRLVVALERRRATRWHRRALAAAVIFVLLAGVAAVASSTGTQPTGTARRSRPALPSTTATTGPIYAAPSESEPVFPPVAHLALARFGSCDELLTYFRDHATEVASSSYMQFSGPMRSPGLLAGPSTDQGGGSGGAASGVAAGSPSSAAAGTSTSNVQEEGVDEPDLTKTDGAHLYVVNGMRLDVVDITGDEPVVTASVPVDPTTRLFLSNGALLALATIYDPTTHLPATVATSYDVADPANPTVTGSATFEGYFVSARLVDGRAQVVTSRTPPLLIPGQVPDVATAIADSSIEDWVGDRPCTTVQHPDEFAGLDVLTIYTVDPAAPDADTSTSLVASAATVYADATDLYVAQQSWESMQWRQGPDGQWIPPADPTTHIHRFEFDALGAVYVASGSVAGRLLDQFSMSQRNGLLRVATTAGFDPSTTTSGVTILETRGSSLATVGQLTGLAPGESITGVRFVEDKAYLVTAVQRRDPLFVVDLHDPTDPTELGHVELPGFSAYVHPLDADHILAVGPDGGSGVAAKLFDVSDPTSPQLTGSVTVPDAWSPVQSDHLAFLYWPARGLAVVPYLESSYTPMPQDGSPWYPVRAGAVAVTFDGSQIAEAGRLDHWGRAGTSASDGTWFAFTSMWRSVVVGDRLFTVSGLGVLASDIDTLGDLGWTPLPSH